jgi:hypothetical protein
MFKFYILINVAERAYYKWIKPQATLYTNTITADLCYFLFECWRSFCTVPASYVEFVIGFHCDEVTMSVCESLKVGPT